MIGLGSDESTQECTSNNNAMLGNIRFLAFLCICNLCKLRRESQKDMSLTKREEGVFKIKRLKDEIRAFIKMGDASLNNY